MISVFSPLLTLRGMLLLHVPSNEAYAVFLSGVLRMALLF